MDAPSIFLGNNTSVSQLNQRSHEAGSLPIGPHLQQAHRRSPRLSLCALIYNLRFPPRNQSHSQTPRPRRIQPSTGTLRNRRIALLLPPPVHRTNPLPTMPMPQVFRTKRAVGQVIGHIHLEDGIRVVVVRVVAFQSTIDVCADERFVVPFVVLVALHVRCLPEVCNGKVLARPFGR